MSLGDGVNTLPTSAARAAGARYRPEILATLAGVVLPNAAYLVGLLLGFGPPLRVPLLGLYLCVLVLARRLPAAATIMLYIAVALFDAAWTISFTFYLPLASALRAFSFVSEINIAASPAYLGLIGGFLLSGGSALAIYLRWMPVLRQASLMPAAVLALLLAGYDGAAVILREASMPTQRSVPAIPESATRLSGFEAALLRPGGANGLLVMVESMGAFASPEHQALLMQAFDDPSIRKAYAVTTGTVPFFGSTTAGEMRELCQTSRPYTDMTPDTARTCLPRRLARAGQPSVAIHGFTSSMFDRRGWYPSIGFTRSIFRETLQDTLPRRCGWVFAGLCDAEIGRMLPQLLPQQPTRGFTYWLTLNSHAPVRPGDAPPRLGCDIGGPFGDVETCRMTEAWMDVMDSVAATALNPGVQRPEILIVGDHAPPSWSWRNRDIFIPGRVAWIRLRPLPAGN